jgi:hypothetical protein
MDIEVIDHGKHDGEVGKEEFQVDHIEKGPSHTNSEHKHQKNEGF